MHNLFNLVFKVLLLILAGCSICYGEYNNHFAIHNNDWRTIYKFNMGTSVSPSNIGIDDQGSLYEIGSYLDQSESVPHWHWLTIKSQDQGQHWTIIDDYNVEGKSAAPLVFAGDHSGNLFVAGIMYPETSNYSPQWVVRKSADGGKTWMIVDKFDNNDSRPLAMTIDSKNNIYVAGYSTDSINVRFGIVRKSSDAGKTWITIGTFFHHGPNSNSVFTDIAGIDVDKNGNIYVIRNGNNDWAVLKNKNFGENPKGWITVDSFDMLAISAMTVNDLKIAPNGDIYVLGTAGKGIMYFENHWIVRKSSDEGKTWRIVDDFASIPQTNNDPSHIGIDNNTGNIYITGRINYQSGGSTGILKASTDGGLTWKIQDQLYTGWGSNILGVAADKLGNIYTIAPNNDGYSWITRRSF